MNSTMSIHHFKSVYGQGMVPAIAAGWGLYGYGDVYGEGEGYGDGDGVSYGAQVLEFEV